MSIPRSLFKHDGSLSHVNAILLMSGHLIGGALLFLILAVLTWLLGIAVSKLHAIHPFAPPVFNILHQAELIMLVLDATLGGLVVCIGAFRFIKEILGEHS